MRRTIWLRLMAVLFALSLLGAACTNNDATDAATEAETPETEETTPEREAAPAVDSAAATLTRDLTHLLAGHEYHAGLAVLTAVQAGGDLEDPTFKAAAGALDDNSQALADAVGSVYGGAAGKQFLSLWRSHIGFFVDYTLGKATGDAAMVKKAKRDLNGYRADFGALIEGATEGGLSQDVVADALKPHVASTFAAIDAVVAGDASAFTKLQTAAGHLPDIATTLAGAIVAQFPERF